MADWSYDATKHDSGIVNATAETGDSRVYQCSLSDSSTSISCGREFIAKRYSSLRHLNGTAANAHPLATGSFKMSFWIPMSIFSHGSTVAR